MSFLRFRNVIEIQKVAIQKVTSCLVIITSYKSMIEVFDVISQLGSGLFTLRNSFLVTYMHHQNYHFYLDGDSNDENLLLFQC
jgi:hypothetical protein